MFDQLFLIPFLTGLCLAVALPLLGCFLRLRDEWLAALAYAHVAAAGALLALIAGFVPMLGGMGAAALVGGGKQFFAQRIERSAGGAAFALLLLGGWALAVLLAANQPLAERLGHALFDGQLYFSGSDNLYLILPWCLLLIPALFWLSRQLLLARLYPDYFQARHLPVWPVVTGFDLLAALTLALATMTLGVMGSFALVFVPPWIVFRRARSWHQGLLLAALIGVLGYVAAFAIALGFDQPFGPVLALLLIAIGLVVA
ncbi:MAG: metal ABC transporter permease [Rhodocyclaceae bacterium]|nr:metal ABC transporter permease [Rhodocyclaceae bacterium]